ncbi:ATP-binding cassette domain-containing protein [Psychrobacter sp. HD31]|uniref:amino acid ABC transporter ATP-binding/permease protein n=1 Tax=Psychrobacter sp. HD31 TaxID=3112003 RepID=UPI003DA6A5A9
MTNQNKNRLESKQYETFRLRDLIKPSFDLWVIAWLLGLVTVFSVVGLLMVSGWFLTATALAGLVALGSHTFNYMMPAAIIRMLAMARTAGRYGELMVSHNAIFSLLKELRLKFFRTLAGKPLNSQHQTLQSSQQMHRLVSDISTLDGFPLWVVSPWFMAIVLTLTLTGFMLFALPTLSVVWKLIIVALMIIALAIPAIMAKRGISHAKQVAHTTEQRRQSLLAPLTIITQLLLWKQWRNQTQDFIKHDDHIHALDWQAQKSRSRTMLLMQWSYYLLMVVILLSVALFYKQIAPSFTDYIAQNSLLPISVPMLLAVILGLFGIQEIVIPLGQNYLALGDSIASKQRLNELLDEQHLATSTTHDSVKNAIALPEQNLIATLKQVNAKMPTAIVGATNVNASIHSGTPLIVTGASGCGKSTLLQTLSNELDPQSGEILLNGHPWQSYNWADQLGYLGQQLDIFDQTLANNLRLGNPKASDDALMDVLEKVGLASWVKSQPQGLQTRLGEYGTAVSGGQARRIALARLLLKPRKVLLLDEPFAGLDATTRTHVWQAVREHQKDGLLVVVSHHHEWAGIGNVDRLDLGSGSLD